MSVNIPAGVAVLYIFASYLPLSADEFGSSIKYSTFVHTIKAWCNHELFAVSVFACAFLFVDLIVGSIEAKAKADLGEYYRWFIWCILTFPYMVCSFSLNYHSHDFGAKMLICNYSFKHLSSIVSAMLLVHRSMGTGAIFRYKHQFVALVFSAFVYQVCFVCAYASESTNEVLLTVSSVITVIYDAQIMTLFLCVLWKSYLYASDKTEIICNSITFICCCSLLAARCICDLVVSISCGSLPGGLEQLSSVGLYADVLIQIVFAVGMIYLPSRLEGSETILFLTNALEEKTTFMRYISHEVRTPLNINELSVQFVRAEVTAAKSAMSAEKTGVIMEAMDDIESSDKAAISILDDVLTFDKIKANKLVIELKDLNPLDLFYRIFKQFKRAADQKSLLCQFTVEDENSGWPEQYRLQADGRKLGQVMRNLLSNALKFTPRGCSISVKLSMSDAGSEGIAPEGVKMNSNSRSWSSLSMGGSRVEQAPKTLRVEVVDTGAGISKQNQKKLFGQYVQFDANRLQKGGGSGLGLWISKEIVALHKGQLSGQSEGEGFGSTFAIELPLHTVAAFSLVSLNGRTHPSEAGGNSLAVSSNAHDDADVEAARPLSNIPEVDDESHPSLLSGFIGQQLAVLSRFSGSSGHPSASASNSNRNSSRISANRSNNGSRGNRGLSGENSIALSGSDCDSAAGTGQGGSEANRRIRRSATAVRSVRSASSAEPSPTAGVTERTLRGESTRVGSVANSSRRAAAAAVSWSTPLRFLVVDDSKPNRKVMGRLLEMYKHEVTFAEDGLQFLQIMEVELAGGADGAGGGGVGCAAGAINVFDVATIVAEPRITTRIYANADRFDVVLMDQYMPNMSGPKATRAIRERGYRGLIIGLTGDTLEEDSEYFRSHGLDAVLSKPLNIDELKAAIGEFYGSVEGISSPGRINDACQPVPEGEEEEHDNQHTHLEETMKAGLNTPQIRFTGRNTAMRSSRASRNTDSSIAVSWSDLHEATSVVAAAVGRFEHEQEAAISTPTITAVTAAAAVATGVFSRQTHNSSPAVDITAHCHNDRFPFYPVEPYDASGSNSPIL